jgi:LPS-assembly protein
MKNTRFCFRLPLLAAGLLALLSSHTYSGERTDVSPSFAEDLASDLYRQQRQPAARNFGQCLGDYELAPISSDEHVPATDASGNRVISAAMDRLIGQRGGSIQFQGNVVIQEGGRRLLAPSALMEQSNERVQFPQGLFLSETNFVVQGQSGELQLDGQSLSLEGVQWVIPGQGLRGTAQGLSRAADGRILLRDALLTRCAPDNAGWLLNINELEVNEAEAYAQGKGAVLRVRSVPVAYLPRLRVPLAGEQTTGWQMPSGSLSSTDGLDIQVPYYWQVSPQMNATLAPRWISERGLGVDGNLSFANQAQVGQLDVAYLPSDDLYNGLYDEDVYKELGGASALGDFNAADRWLIAADQAGKVGVLRTRVDFARASDRDFFRDLDSYVGFTKPNALNQLVEVSYAGKNLDVSLRSLGFQRLDELNIADYEAVPSLQISYRSNPLDRGFGVNLQAQWSQFNRNAPVYSSGAASALGIEGNRSHLAPSLSYRRDYTGGFWAVTGGYKLTRYDLDHVPAAASATLEAQTDRDVGFFSVDAGLFFDRELSLNGGLFLQTLEPRVYYLRQGYERQDALPIFDSVPLNMTFEQLFLDNHFSGLDRIGDADRATLAITSRLINPAGQEVLTLSAGHLQHFSTPRVTVPGFADVGINDMFAGDVALSLSDHWQLRSQQLWNYDQSQWEEVGGSLHWRGEGLRRFNFGFKDRRLDNIKQAEMSAYAPVNQNVALTARWHYDLEGHRTLEAFAGFEYDDCCLRMRLVARQYLENPSYRLFGAPASVLPSNFLRTDRSVSFEVQLKGLAEIGSKVEALLQRGVYGYASPAMRMQRYNAN